MSLENTSHNLKIIIQTKVKFLDIFLTNKELEIFVQE